MSDIATLAGVVSAGTRELLGGTQVRVHFSNGYGVSVVRHQFSYGGSEGLYELAVLDKDGELTYDTPITGDVLGYLTEDDVREAAIAVSRLEGDEAP